MNCRLEREEKMDKFILDKNYIAIKNTLFANQYRTEIMLSLNKVCLCNELERFDVFSVIRLKAELDILIEKFLEVLFFS